jgi:hypothetical protein
MVRGKISAARRKIPSALASKQGALTGKQAADARALALLPTIREIIAAGFATDHRLVNELNRKGITGARGGRWYRSSLRRLLTRLRQLTSKHGGTDNSLAVKRVANVRAEPYSPTTRRASKCGLCLWQGHSARVERARDTSKWHPATVTRLALTGSIVSRAAARAVFCPWNRFSHGW